MPGYNLETYRQTMFQAVHAWGWKTARPPDMRDTLTGRLLHDALVQIQGELKVQRDRQALNLAANAQAVNLPSNVYMRSIRRVEVIASGATRSGEITHLSYSDFQDRYEIDSSPDITTDAGAPVDWCINEAANRQILLGPAPDYTLAGGLILHFDAQVDPLVRNYHSAAQTVAITGNFGNGSTAVTISDTTPDDDKEIEAGDEIGVVPTFGADEVAVTGEAPEKWYRVASISGTALVLETAYGETTNAAASFITAEVPTMELIVPGGLLYAPSYLAVANMLENSNPTLSAQFMTKYLTVIDRKRVQSPTRIRPSWRAGRDQDFYPSRTSSLRSIRIRNS